eukprot:5025-Heterococcus_DN1.PRE.5
MTDPQLSVCVYTCLRRDLFNLPSEELRSAKQEAAARVQGDTYRQQQDSARSGSSTSRSAPRSYRVPARAINSGSTNSRVQQDDAGLLLTARAHREAASRPVAGAPFDDPRFVIPRHGQQQQQQQQLQQQQQQSVRAAAQIARRTVVQVPPLNFSPLGESTNSINQLPAAPQQSANYYYSVQAPGLSAPAPPTVPFPGELKSDSARLLGSARRGNGKIAP